MNFFQPICECGVNWVHLYFNKSSHWWAQLLTLFLKMETRVWSLGQEGPLKKGMFTDSSILSWRIPRTEEPGRLQTMGVTKNQTLLSDWCFLLYIYTFQQELAQHLTLFLRLKQNDFASFKRGISFPTYRSDILTHWLKSSLTCGCMRVCSVASVRPDSLQPHGL